MVDENLLGMNYDGVMRPVGLAQASEEANIWVMEEMLQLVGDRAERIVPFHEVRTWGRFPTAEYRGLHVAEIMLAGGAESRLGPVPAEPGGRATRCVGIASGDRMFDALSMSAPAIGPESRHACCPLLAQVVRLSGRGTPGTSSTASDARREASPALMRLLEVRAPSSGRSREDQSGIRPRSRDRLIGHANSLSAALEGCQRTDRVPR